MLFIAKGLLEEEVRECEVEKRRYMAETCPPVCMPRTMQELQVGPASSSAQAKITRIQVSSVCVQELCKLFTARLTRLMRNDTTFR